MLFKKNDKHAQAHALRRVRGKAPMEAPTKMPQPQKAIEKECFNHDSDEEEHVPKKAKNKKNVSKKTAHRKNTPMSSNVR